MGVKSDTVLRMEQNFLYHAWHSLSTITPRHSLQRRNRCEHDNKQINIRKYDINNPLYHIITTMQMEQTNRK